MGMMIVLNFKLITVQYLSIVGEFDSLECFVKKITLKTQVHTWN